MNAVYPAQWGFHMFNYNRKCQNYIHEKLEHYSKKIKRYLGHENKSNENEVSPYCEALRYMPKIMYTRILIRYIIRKCVSLWAM